MGAQGIATLDFGAFPGTSDAALVITGQASILSGSLVEAWILPVTTTDHTADEHWVEELRVFAGNIVASTGFTIYGVHQPAMQDIESGQCTNVYGVWNIGWVWN